MIYLDHNATSPLRPEALEAMLPVLRETFANPSASHRLGSTARARVEEARFSIAERLGAEASEVVFTSGGTESNNSALFGIAAEMPGARLVVSPIEHSSIIGPVYEIARHGVPLTWLPVDGDGRIDPDDVAPAISGYRAIVSVGWANNEIGTIQPIREIAEVCNQHGAVLHVDAVQAAGKIGIDFENLDLCSLSAHKLGGPKGVGALLVRKNLRLRPLMFGGPQERGRRPGTENVAGIVGFAAALALKPMGEHVELLRERLWAGVSQLGGVRNSPPVGCLPNTLNVAFEDLRGEAVVAALDLEGVAVSVGSACAAGSAEPSHVLRAIGRSDEDARAAIRFSLGSQTTVEEIDTVIEVLARVVERMRRVRGKQVAHG